MLRSYLYVPGDRPERIAKAWMLCEAGGANAPDALILDLEDAVAVPRKADALAGVAEALQRPRPGSAQILVRVNSGRLGAADVEALGPLRPDGFYVPKADASTSVTTHGVPVVALIETALGLRDVDVVATRPGVRNLALGEADLAGELGIDRGADHAWWPIRMQVVVASAAARLDPPTAPVYTDVDDPAGLRASCVVLRAAGFAARAAIHPAQVAIINEVFRPTADEVAAARTMIDEFDAATARGVGVYVDEHGRMIDEAVVRSARRLLA